MPGELSVRRPMDTILPRKLFPAIVYRNRNNHRKSRRVQKVFALPTAFVYNLLLVKNIIFYSMGEIVIERTDIVELKLYTSCL